MKGFFMKRIFCIFLILTCILALPAISAHAEEATATEEALPVAPATEDIARDNTAPVDEGDFWHILSNIWSEYSGEIFSALTLFVSLLLAYFYKRGLVPTIWNGLEKINRAGTEANEVATSIAKTCDEKIEGFFEMAQPLLGGIATVTEQADALASYVKKLEARLEQTEDERTRIKVLMRSTADMLYGVFSAANLPQYAKEQLGQQYTHLLTALEGDAEVAHDEEKPAV